MSLIKANAVQIGQSPTATQNFTLAVPSSPNDTIKLARGNAGATTQDVMTVSNTGVVSFPQGLGNISNSTAIATGSTTARSLANRFADVVNVKDFGAVGDGVTDDTAAIQETLNSGAKSVFFPSGTYMIGAAGLTGVSNQNWVGDGFQKTILKMAVPPTLDMVYINNCPDFGIEGITFDGNGKLTAGVGHFPSLLPCIYIVNSNRCYIRNCGFIGFYNCGLLINVSSYSTIEYNFVDRGTAVSFVNHGIVISSDTITESTGNFIRNNELYYCQISTNCNKSIISHNYVVGWGFSAGINTQAIYTNHSMVITDNICFNSNQVPDVSPYYMAGIENWASNTVISNNICFGNLGSGIDQGGRDCIVSSNICYNNRGYGLFNSYQDATYNASNTLVIGNQFYDTRSGAARTQQGGYYEDVGGLTGICFSKNICRNNIGNNVLNCTLRNSASQYDFIAPTLINSWVNYGNPAIGADAGYYKDTDNIVHLRGLVKSGTIPSNSFYLPLGFRPQYPLYFPVASNNAFGMVIISTGGDVIINQGSNVYVDLGSISFRAI